MQLSLPQGTYMMVSNELRTIFTIYSSISITTGTLGLIANFLQLFFICRDKKQRDSVFGMILLSLCVQVSFQSMDSCNKIFIVENDTCISTETSYRERARLNNFRLTYQSDLDTHFFFVRFLQKQPTDFFQSHTVFGSTSSAIGFN